MYVPCVGVDPVRMSRKSPYYYPKISRFLVSVLYHEARSRQMPMTELAESLLRERLEGSKSWRTAKASLVQEEAPEYRAKKTGQSAAISSAGSAPSITGKAPRCEAAPARTASRASAAPSSPTRASKGTTLQRLSGNQNSPTLKEFQRACGERGSNKL